MSEPEKVLVILSPGFPANEADTSCLPAQQQLVRAINKNFPALKIIIMAFQYPYINETYSWYGNTVVSFGGKNRKRLSRVLTWLRVTKKLRALKKQYSIKGVFCCWYGECAFVGRQFAQKNGIKYFTWLLGQDAKPGNKYVNLTGATAGELLAISDFIAHEFEKNYGILPAQILTNAVTPDIFPAPPLWRDIDLICVGSLISLKRVDVFIDVVEALKKKFPGIKAVICGDGPEKEKLWAIINKKALTDNVELTGELSYTEVLHMMQRSKVLLHPSEYEGFSGVCLEALYAGAHVISFCNPKNDWIRHWHIVKNGKEMETIAQEILTNEKTAYRSVLPYDMKDVAKQLVALFD